MYQEDQPTPPPAGRAPVVFQGPPNRIAALGVVTLAIINLLAAEYWFKDHRVSSFISLIIGGLLLALSLWVAAARYELAVVPSERVLRLRRGTRSLAIHRDIAFTEVQSVRLTLCEASKPSHIEIVSRRGEIPCPPTSIPREEALYLAVMLNVPLIKITNGAGHKTDRQSEMLRSDRAM